MTTTGTTRRRRGRPAGSSGSRERILASARELFARNGIRNTSIRAVAAAVQIPIDPMQVIGPLREVPVDDLGYALPSMLLPLWDSEVGAAFIATLRSILAGEEISLFRTFIQDVIGVEVGPRVDNPAGSGVIRIQFVASQLVGVVMARYILELEPFASLPPEQIAATIAPNLQRYLTGDLPDGLAP
ncbi:TetR family transcriptional regulator [Mycobacterium avium subsp. hominissuis]